VAETQLSHGLRQSNNSKEGSWRNIHVALFDVAFALEFALLDILCDDVVVQHGRNDRAIFLSVGKERSHDIVTNLLTIGVVCSRCF
jgi:hypothetical protein